MMSTRELSGEPAQAPSRLSVPTTRSAMAFAFGARTAVRKVRQDWDGGVLATMRAAGRPNDKPAEARPRCKR